MVKSDLGDSTPPNGAGASNSLETPRGPAYNPLLTPGVVLEQLWQLSSVQALADGTTSIVLSACPPPSASNDSSEAMASGEGARTVRLVAAPADSTSQGPASLTLVLGADVRAAIAGAASPVLETHEPEAKVAPDATVGTGISL